MYLSPTRETMAQYDDHQRFEAEPQKLTFHELLERMVRSRLNKISISADRISKAYDIHTREEMHPTAVNAFNPKFAHEILKEHVPDVIMTGALSAFDKENALETTAGVVVEKIGPEQPFDDPATQGFESPDEAEGNVVNLEHHRKLREARARENYLRVA